MLKGIQMVSGSESICYFLRKGMDLHDLKQLELILIFKDFEQNIFSPLNLLTLSMTSIPP